MCRILLVSCVFTMSMPPQLDGQGGNPTFTSRAEQIQAEWMDKAARLSPDTPSRVEKRFDKVQSLVDKIFFGSPVRLTIGAHLGLARYFGYPPHIDLYFLQKTKTTS